MSKRLSRIHIASLVVGASIDSHRYFIGAFTTPLRAAISLTQNRHMHFVRALPKFDVTLSTIKINDNPNIDPGVPESSWTQLSVLDDDIEDAPGPVRYVYLLAERKSEPPYVFPLGVYGTKDIAHRNGAMFAEHHYTTVCTYVIAIDPHFPNIADASDIQTRDYYTMGKTKRHRPLSDQDDRASKKRKLEHATLMDPIPQHLRDFSILPTPTPARKDQIQDLLDDFFGLEEKDAPEKQQDDSYEDDESEFILPSFGFTTVGSGKEKVEVEAEHKSIDEPPPTEQKNAEDSECDISVISLSAEVSSLKGMCTELSGQLAELRALVLKSSESISFNKDSP